MSTFSEPELWSVEVTLCTLCMAGQGGECHTPGCALWMNRAPDVPLADKVKPLRWLGREAA